MKRLALFFVVFATTAICSDIDLSNARVGSLPPGWSEGVTGKGASRWTVEIDPGDPGHAKVLEQSAEGKYPWCVLTDSRIENGHVEVEINPVGGTKDRAGGILWRFKDENNYYVARANALEDNVTIYHIIDGRRRSFQSVRVPIQANAWHRMRVDFSGADFRVWFDGKTVLEGKDDKISGFGKVGLYTRQDSVTMFRHFAYGEHSRIADPAVSR